MLKIMLMVHYVVLCLLCFLDMFDLPMIILLCLANCAVLSLTFCRSLMVGWSRGRLQFKEEKMTRTSLHRIRTLLNLVSHQKLMVGSPTYKVRQFSPIRLVFWVELGPMPRLVGLRWTRGMVGSRLVGIAGRGDFCCAL